MARRATHHSPKTSRLLGRGAAHRRSADLGLFMRRDLGRARRRTPDAWGVDTAASSPQGAQEGSLLAAANDLKVRTPHSKGYSRDEFGLLG